MNELIKRAIFIELEPGRARRGYTPSLRWHLRPVLCPMFATSLARNIAIKWTPEEFRYFISDPEESCGLEFGKRWKVSKKAKRRVEDTMESLSKWTDEEDLEGI